MMKSGDKIRNEAPNFKENQAVYASLNKKAFIGC